VRYRAPGRVNIIGEHTDYNDGFVLPTTTSAYTNVTANRRNDREVHLYSRNLDTSAVFDLDDTSISEAPIWADYARGVAVEIERDGTRLVGADITIDGEIPIGGGLSSSASFEVAIGTALLDLAGQSLPERRLARICREAEIHFAGVNCGIMDQMAIAGCEKGKAMLIDCRTLETEHVDIPEHARLLVVDSGVRHQLPDSGYNDRARECRDVVEVLAALEPGVTALRDVSVQSLDKHCDKLGDVLYRRARHIVTENGRVHEAFDALAGNDLVGLGALVSQSHLSLRDDFEISCQAVDQLVEIANACRGSLGARQVGGGFGGCVLCLTTDDHLPHVQEQIRLDYGRVLGTEPWMHVVQATEPAGRVDTL
jgi:galactokinase